MAWWHDRKFIETRLLASKPLGADSGVVSRAMYVKTSIRKTKNGQVRYLQLAHNEWDAADRRAA